MLKVFYKIIFCFLFLLTRNLCIGQHDIGAWNVISFKLNFNKHWSLFEEAQLRSQQFYHNFSYIETKGGIAYAFRNFSALVGFGRFMTFTDGDDFKKPYVNKEWRLWEQFLVNTDIGRFKLENRIRIEQRWTTAFGFRSRLKYRLNGTVPLNHKKIIPGTLYVSGWDEIYFTNSDPHLETNRIYGGAGYRISSHLSLQSGFLSVTNYRIDDTHSGKNYIQISLVIEANAHKDHSNKDRTHSTAD